MDSFSIFNSTNALWANECNIAIKGLKIVALWLPSLPFCCCYENVFHSTVAITTKEKIEL